MKRGFTLIELLAVIVLIAIIAVITIPIIGSAIEKAKLGALKDSAYGLIDAGVIYNAQYQNEADARFDIINGNQTTTESNKLKYKGNVENGTVVISSTGKVLVCINSGKYKAYKDFNENEVTVTKKSDVDDVCSVSVDDENNTVLDKTSGNIKNSYPVGSVYISVDDVDPHDLFGGEWEKIEGRFLLSSSGDYTLNSIGGEATHTLTVDEMPSHTHTRGTMNITGQYNPGEYGETGQVSVSGAFTKVNAQYKDGFNTAWKNGAIGIQFDASKSWTGETSSVGGNQSHNNMPPYLVVNMWKRTA